MVPLEAGRQTIRFNVTHEGWNINYFTISVPVEIPSYEGVSMVNRWKNQYLTDDGSGVLKYAGNIDSDNIDAYSWDFIPDEDGYYTIRTGRPATILSMMVPALQPVWLKAERATPASGFFAM